MEAHLITRRRRARPSRRGEDVGERRGISASRQLVRVPSAEQTRRRRTGVSVCASIPCLFGLRSLTRRLSEREGGLCKMGGTYVPRVTGVGCVASSSRDEACARRAVPLPWRGPAPMERSSSNGPRATEADLMSRPSSSRSSSPPGALAHNTGRRFRLELAQPTCAVSLPHRLLCGPSPGAAPASPSSERASPSSARAPGLASPPRGLAQPHPRIPPRGWQRAGDSVTSRRRAP